MYTEGFDELSEAENRPQRTYVSAGGQEPLKLQRENERLKKTLEKEQFFNKLLDQELKDLKAAKGDEVPQNYMRPVRQGGVSRKAFNALLVITIALAGFLAYTLLYNKQYNLFPQPVSISALTEPVANPVGAIRDSVPNIIAQKTVAPPPAASRQNNVAVQKPVAKETKTKNKPEPSETDAAVANQPATAVNQPAAATEQTIKTPSEPAPAPARLTPTSKSVIGNYVVTSKANFYSAPDENTLRSYFISPGSDKVVNALEEKNGFIYVEFQNDVGYVTKGWLSKADLTKQ